MSVISAVMKDITHYFRPSSKNDRQADGCLDCSKSNSNIEDNEELKNDDCRLYLSESDDERDFVTPKKKPHLVVQIPGVSVCQDSVRKRKCEEDITPRAKKIKTLQCDLPVLRPREFNLENVKEESFHMSPLRLDSDSSPEGSPTREQTSVISLSDNSPVYRTSGKRKLSLRLAKNPFLNPSKSKTEILAGTPKAASKSPLGQGAPVTGKNELSKEKEASGSLHKYFENVSAVKSRSCSTSPEVECVSSPRDKESVVVVIGGDSVKSKAKLEGETNQIRESPRKKAITPTDNQVVTSPPVKSMAKSRGKPKLSKDSVGREQEAGTSSASKCKNYRLWGSSKRVAEGLKNSTNNNIMNYFEKAKIPKKSKRRKLKRRKVIIEEKMEPKVVPAVKKSNASRCVEEKVEPEVTFAVQKSSANCRAKVKTRRSSRNGRNLKRVPLNDSSAPSVQVKDSNCCTNSLSNDAIDESESLENGTTMIRRRSRSSQSSGSMLPKATVTPPVNPKSQRPTATTMEKSKSKKKRKKQKGKETRLHLTSPEVVKKVAVAESSKNSPESCKKSISPVCAKQRSVNQCRATAIVKRACRQPQPKQETQRISDSKIPGISSSDEVIILNEKTSSGATKEIVIKPSFVKLAPLFVTKEELQRKKFFLQSGAPEVVLRRMKQQKRMEVELEEASDFPLVSHTQQKETTFPWCLETNPKLLKHLWCCHTDHLGEQEEMLTISSRRLCLGIITSLPSFLAAMLIHLRPPLPNVDSTDVSSIKSSEDLESPDCFCEALSPENSLGEKSQVYSPADIEMFERVHAWLMRSLLPPGVAYKMCVDLSFFLPSSLSAGFENDHIFVVPRDSSGPSLRKEMLLKLKEDYPTYPVNRKYKDFYLRKKSDGGLYAYTIPPIREVITLDDNPPGDGNDKSGDEDSLTNPENLKTSSKLRRSARSVSVSHSTPIPAAEVKDVSEQVSDSGPNSMLSINDIVVKAPCSSLLTSESWTDIFAPASFIDACSLGRNLKTLEKLRNWLDSWAKKSTSRGNEKDRKGSSWSDSEEECSSGNEFCSSGDEDSNRESKNLPTNVAILIGPCGSGKTSSVYALAKELNYKVLEINASSKRSGKYILATVKEATRSYQVMSSVGQNSPASIGSFFKKNTPSKLSASAQKKTPKKSPKPSEKASSAMSVIFVEDVDVIFENEDEGFIGALTSLTTSTKRPVILEVHTSKPLRMGTTNNWLLEETLTEACPHLINFLARQNRTPLILPFERNRSNLHSEALLRVACLSEGIWVSKQWSEYVIKQTAGDFRRAIQEAQFWAGSVARSSIMLDNCSRYPKEFTQKGDMDDEKSSLTLMAQKLPPVNFCGCIGRRACSYPYSWMHEDYIQHIWLNLDRIVGAAMMLMQNVDYSGTGGGDKAFCLSPSDQRSLKSTEKEEILKKESLDTSSNKEISSEMSSIRRNLLLNFNGAINTKKSNQVISPPVVRQSSRINKGNRRINLPIRHRRSSSKKNSPSDLTAVRHAKEPEVSEKEEGIIKEDKVTDDASEMINSVLNRERSKKEEVQKKMDLSSEGQRKMNLLAYGDYLDVLCTSDVFLKKFQTAGSPEVGKNLVFEIGSITKLISLSGQVCSSEKSREMEAKQAKDSCTAAQYQMILPIMPDHWLLNYSALALDVAPHIRETCRILDELSKAGRTRTRLSHRLPTINRVGPTLREALCRTLVDDFDHKSTSDVQIGSVKDDTIKSEK